MKKIDYNDNIKSIDKNVFICIYQYNTFPTITPVQTKFKSITHDKKSTEYFIIKQFNEKD